MGLCAMKHGELLYKSLTVSRRILMLNKKEVIVANKLDLHSQGSLQTNHSLFNARAGTFMQMGVLFHPSTTVRSSAC